MRDIAIFLAIALAVMGVVFFTTSPIEAPDIDPACAQWVDTHPVQPSSKFGLKLSASTIDIEMQTGETVEVMTITSAPSTGFNFCGYPYPPGSPDLVWSPWSGSLHLEASTTVTITAMKAGEYTGKVLLIDLTSGLSKEIPVRIVVK